MGRLIYIFVFLFIVSSCERSTDWDLDALSEPRLVVEAILTNEIKQQEVLLSQTFDQLNEEVPRVTDAQISLEANGLTYEFSSDPQQPGRYLSNTVFGLLPFLEYTLTIEWEGTSYMASGRMAAAGPIPPVTFVRAGKQTELRLGNFVPPLSNSEQAMYQVDIDWSHLQPDTINQARQYFYTFRDIDISQLLPPAKEQVIFPAGSIVVVRKFGLSDSFAEYLRAKAIETDWNGSFFFGPADNLPSNFSNGALGFFGVCEVETETLIAQ